MRSTKLCAIALVVIALVPQLASSAETWKQLLDRADSLSSKANYDSAIVIGRLALDEVQAEFGQEDTATARVLHRLGTYYLQVAAYMQADSLLRRALAIREQLLGPDHLDVATTMNTLGILYMNQSRLAEAEPFYKKALAIREKALGSDHPDVAASLNNLGLFYSNQGRYAEAEPMYIRALAIREKTLGSDHPDVATSLNNLSIIYQQQGRYAEAEPLIRRALAIREKLLGPDHPEVAGTLMNLGASCWNQSRYTEAEPLYKRALLIWEAALGPDHPDLAAVLNNLGNLYWYQGRYAEAEPLQKRALAISEKALGPDHPDVALSLMSLGVFYWDQGYYAEAEPLYKRALAITEKAFGPDHRDVASSLIDLGVLYMDQGRYAEAEPFYRRALAIWEKILGPDHPDLATSLLGLGVLYVRQGRYAEAEPLYQKALTIMEIALGPDHPRVAGSLLELGILYMEQERYAEAEPPLRRALQIKERALGSSHPDVALALVNLASLATRQGHYKAAEPLYIRALTVAQTALGPHHLDVAGIRDDYSTFCRLTGDLAQANSEAQQDFAIRLRNFRENGSVLSEKDALAFSQALRRSAENCLSCYLDAKSADSAQIRSVYDVIFATKGLVSDGIFERQTALVTEQDSTLLALAESLRLARFQASKLYVSGPGDDTTGVYRKELDSLTKVADDFEAELSRKSASFRKRQEDQDVTSSRVAVALPPKAVLLDYMQYGYQHLKPDTAILHYLVTVLTSDGNKSVVDLGEAAGIDSLVASYRKHLLMVSRQEYLPTVVERSAYQTIAQTLYQRVVRPVESFLNGNAPVFIAPDGGLNLVSFAGLLDDQNKYLIEAYPIHYLSSGRDLIRLKEKTSEGHGLLALGDPDFDASIAARLGGANQPVYAAVASESENLTRNVRSSCGSLADLHVDGLPYTRDEVHEAARLWQGTGEDSAGVFIGAQATEDIFKAGAPGRRAIHLATHGYYLSGRCAPQLSPRHRVSFDEGYVGENPLLQSGLLLAGSNLHGVGSDRAHCEDGILSASEVSGLDLTGTDLVVLSACETGLGEVKEGEGVYGLRRAFQMAGARTVISSLWPVPDQATAEVMSQLYGQSKASLPERLRNLQLAQIKKLRASGSSDHPYSWAAFIALGDWR